MKKYLPVLILSTLIIPQVIFAAWWNPFSWKMFSWLPWVEKAPVVQVEQGLKSIASSTETVAASTEKSELETLKKEAGEARAAAESERLRAEKAKAEVEAIQSDTERKLLQSEVDKLKAENETTKQKTENTNKNLYCNGKYWTQCPVGQTFVCPPTGNASCKSPQNSALQEIVNRLNNLVKEMDDLSQKMKGYQNGSISAYQKMLACKETYKSYQTEDTTEQLKKSGLSDELSKSISNDFGVLYKNEVVIKGCENQQLQNMQQYGVLYQSAKNQYDQLYAEYKQYDLLRLQIMGQ